MRVVNLLQTQWGALFTNTEDFSGRPSVVDGGGYVTYVGQENRQLCRHPVAGLSWRYLVISRRQPKRNTGT